MFVDTGLLRSGGNESHRAGGHAQEGADHLSAGPLGSGMFGKFAAADAFHEAVTSAHTRHVKTLQGHQETLTEVGRKAHYAATEFTDMDEDNAAELRAVRGGSVT
ncbi:MAG: DUF2563 family protein [Mycobacterium sp.]